MKKISAYPEILYYYYLSYKEILNISIMTQYNSYTISKTFNNQKMIDMLRNEIDCYLENIKKEIKLLNFMFKNENKLYYNDIMTVLDKIDNNFEKRWKHCEEMLENLEVALGTELDYKFYIPKKRYNDLTDNDIKQYINYAKGFSIERVRDFLFCEEMLDDEEFNMLKSQMKIIFIDAKENSDLFGVFDKGIVLPKITDQFSTLLTIHEITHWSLLYKREKYSLNDDILLSEDLPIFMNYYLKQQMII